jgi:hypothetical protein
MRIPQGGTKLWCPDCEKVRVCKGINPSEVAGESGQRWQRTDHKDINWFRRGRECQDCSFQFLTAEVDEDFLSELVRLRDTLKSIKVNAEAYLGQAADAAVALAKLTESLGKLRALQSYQSA